MALSYFKSFSFGWLLHIKLIHIGLPCFTIPAVRLSVCHSSVCFSMAYVSLFLACPQVYHRAVLFVCPLRCSHYMRLLCLFFINRYRIGAGLPVKR